MPSSSRQPINYNDFRTGYSWQEIRDMMWGDPNDPSTWPLANHKNRRHTVLGKWRQIKLEMYDNYLQGFREPESAELPF